MKFIAYEVICFKQSYSFKAKFMPYENLMQIQMVGQFDKRAWTAKTSEDSLLYLYLY